MSKQIDTLKMALEAWEKGDGIKLGKILNEALEQPSHDSVAMADYMALVEKYAFLKASQRTWVGLTDEEYKNLHLQMGSMYFYQDYGRAIEAKLKEKNT